MKYIITANDPYSRIKSTYDEVNVIADHDDITLVSSNDAVLELAQTLGIHSYRTSPDNFGPLDDSFELAGQLGPHDVFHIPVGPAYDHKHLAKLLAAKDQYHESIICGHTQTNYHHDVISNNNKKIVYDEDNILLYASSNTIPAQPITPNKSFNILYPAFIYEVAHYSSQPRQIRTPLEEIENVSILYFQEIGLPIRTVLL